MYHVPLAKEPFVMELLSLLYGNIMQDTSMLGSAGETTKSLEEKYGIRSLIMADGPAGIRCADVILNIILRTHCYLELWQHL